MIGWYLKRADPVLARMWKVSTEKSAYEFTNWEIEKDAWVREFHENVRVLRHSFLCAQWFTEIPDRSGMLMVSMPSLVQDWLRPL